MVRVFVSYRKSDSLDITGRLADALRARLGPDAVFWDERSIAGGEVWPEKLKREVEACDVLLAVIGPGWLTADDEYGRRRLDLPDDWVRAEIETALALDKRVIPVLTGGAAALTKKAGLPPAIEPLCDRQAVRLESGAAFDAGFGVLLALIEGLAKDLPFFRSKLLLDVFGVLFTACDEAGVEFLNAARRHRRHYQDACALAIQALKRPVNSLEVNDTGALEEIVATSVRGHRLARMGGILTAVSDEIAAIAKDHTLYCEEYGLFASVTPQESIWAKLPRQQSEISDTLATYHPRLTITRVDSGPVGFTVRQIPPRLSVHLRERRSSLRIALHSMGAHGVQLKVTKGVDGDPDAFVVDGVEEEARQAEQLPCLLQRCHDEGAAVLVLPELRISPRLENVIRDWLDGQSITNGRGILLVVAGSWHVRDGEDHVNRTRVIGHRGEVIWEQDKLAEFHLSGDNVAAAREYWTARGVGPLGAYENIRVGSRQVLVETPLGRMLVAICAGFFHERAEAVMKASGANFFFVPAMTPSAKDMKRTAEGLVRYGGGTFAANCGSVGGGCFYLEARAGAAIVESKDDLLVWEFSDTLVMRPRRR